MFLKFILIVFLSHVASYSGVSCLINQTSCSLTPLLYGVKVICTNASWVGVKEVLADVPKRSSLHIYLEICDVLLPHLSENLLMGFNVVHLTFQRCNISSVDDYAFHGIEDKLVLLKISENYLDEVPSRALVILSRLMYLVLDKNHIATLKAESFKGLYFLRRLYLSENRIKFIDDMAFTGLRGLEMLLLNDNELSTFPFGSLRSLNSLSSLNLGNNKIQSMHPLTFQGVESTLKCLNLSNNQLKDIPTQSLINLTRLEEFYVNGNNICIVRNYSFLPFGKTLQWIFLQNNSLTHIESGALHHLEILSKLHLYSNQLTTLHWDTFAPVLDTVHSLYVYGNPLHCDCNINWIRDWKTKNPFGINPFGLNVSDIKCSSPEELRGANLTQIPENKLVCRDSKPPIFKCVAKNETENYHIPSNSQGRFQYQNFIDVIGMLSLYYFLLYVYDITLFK